ncbi:MAG: hypothetical protein KGO49_03900 [Gammaproteobacteria bacterium]|nr:hypothetical protein [Gammaproteobacteria bacterium]
MKSKSYDLEGFIRINGEVYSEGVNIFTSKHELIVANVDKSSFSNTFNRKKLFLRHLNLQMLRNFNVVNMKSGFFFRIQETKVGSYMEGPLGHPADGEFNVRPISEFQVRSQYIDTMLVVEIEGITELGYNICNFSGEQGDSNLASWSFNVLFKIPRTEMKDFFQFTDQNFPFFEKLLDDCKIDF